MWNKFRKFLGYKFPRLGRLLSQVLINLIKSPIDVELFPNIKVDMNLKDLTQQATFWQGDRFEYPTAKVFKEYAGNCKLFFDIGSNYGFYSYLMHSYFEHLKCFAFEPNPNTFAKIEKIIEYNNLDRMKCFQIGLGDKNYMLDLHPGIEDSGHSTFLEHPEFKMKTVGEEVQIKPFDEWRIDHAIGIPIKPAWIAKIDVEGFELNVLKGMEESLRSKAFIILSVEILAHTLLLNNNKPEDIYNYLAKFNYKPLSKEYFKKEYGHVNTENVFFVPS
jgi:FkbM family methyltransferase